MEVNVGAEIGLLSYGKGEGMSTVNKYCINIVSSLVYFTPKMVTMVDVWNT